MSVVDIAYLGFVIGSLTVFAVTLAYASWRSP